METTYAQRFKLQMIQWYHVQLGHLGRIRTFLNMPKWLYWKTMKKNGTHFVSNCKTCMETKPDLRGIRKVHKKI